MQKKLLAVLNEWPKSYISSGDLMVVLGGSSNAVHSLLKRAVKEETLIRLKRDFYLISSKIQTMKPEAFEIAALLYGPSYISFESALSFHGWIPEAVFSIHSASSKRAKTIETFFGTFVYYFIPVSIFHVGISSSSSKILEDKKGRFFIADPWKAIADLIYVRKKTWSNVMALADDLRIELDLIQYSDLTLLANLAENYPSKRVRKILQLIKKDFNI